MVLEILKALANEVRLEIVKILLNNDYCITDFTKFFDKDFSVIYRHIKYLEKANIVEIKRYGRYNTVCLKNPDLIKKLFEILEQLSKDKSENNR